MYSGKEDTALSDMPQLKALLDKLKQETFRVEDFQYLVTLEGNRIVFRMMSVLDDYIQISDSGLFVPKRGLLTHFQEHFGGFTSERILELEELLNNPKTKERDFQIFFERNPHFFRKWDYREIHPHVYLTRQNEGPLIPDFILNDKELQKALIIELKLSNPVVVRRQQNREPFASSVMEARSQMLQYRDWFRKESATLKTRIRNGNI